MDSARNFGNAFIARLDKEDLEREKDLDEEMYFPFFNHLIDKKLNRKLQKSKLITNCCLNRHRQPKEKMKHKNKWIRNYRKNGMKFYLDIMIFEGAILIMMLELLKCKLNNFKLIWALIIALTFRKTASDWQ